MSFLQSAFKVSLFIMFAFPGLIFNQNSEHPNFLTIDSGIAVSADEKKASNRKTRKTPAIRERVYSQLSRAQKLVDENNAEEGMAVLERMKSRINQLNSYEKAMLWNTYAFIYYGKDDSEKAIESFNQVIQQKSIPESLELSTIFSLAQLYMAEEKYSKTIEYIKRWQQIKGEQLDNNALVLQANAYYAMKQYPLALESISAAVSNSFTNNKIPKENWLVLKRAIDYELKKTKEVTLVSEQLVKYYSKASYWIDLANMYGETDQTDKQLSVMEAAYQQGFVTKKIDIQTLSQLYYEAGAPYKSAELLSKSIDSGIILENIKILGYLAQAWTSAKEIKKAIPVLKRAANLSKSGNFDAKLAGLYIEDHQWKKAISAAKVALDKGNLDRPGNVQIALGMAYFNLNKFDQSITSFEMAMQQKSQRTVAKQWIKYAKSEKEKYTLLKNITS